jgi:Cu/Ag efflux pump CusA
VESEVTKYLEDELSTTPNLDRLESKSKDNISIVNCIFDWGTDLDVAVNDIREKIDLAKPDLADGAEEPFIFKFSSSMVPVLVMTVTAKESSPDLYRIVDKQIADPLKRIPGVGAILFIGGQERQINVHFDREALDAYQLSAQNRKSESPRRHGEGGKQGISDQGGGQVQERRRDRKRCDRKERRCACTLARRGRGERLVRGTAGVGMVQRRSGCGCDYPETVRREHG